MSPAWSPDGSKLAYVTFESGRSALVIQTLANGAVRQVASFPRHNGAPAFSPDGSKLAFALSKTGSLNLYVMDLASGQIRQLPGTLQGHFNLFACADVAERTNQYVLTVIADLVVKSVFAALPDVIDPPGEMLPDYLQPQAKISQQLRFIFIGLKHWQGLGSTE